MQIGLTDLIPVLSARLAALVLSVACVVMGASSAHAGNAQLRHSNPSGPPDASNFAVCGSAVRNVQTFYDLCQVASPSGRVGKVCEPIGCGPNPWRMTHTLFRDGVPIATQTIPSSRAWSNWTFSSLTLTPGTYQATVRVEFRKLWGCNWTLVETASTNSFVVSSVPANAQATIQGVGDGGQVSVCACAPIRLNDASTCASGHFVSVQQSNASWGLTGPEYMRWLTAADLAAYGPVTDFDLSGFFGSFGQTFLPGQYYRVSLAVGPVWDAMTILVYVEPATVSGGMTAWYCFDELAGSIASDNFGNDGAYEGDASHVAGLINAAARIGTNGRIRVPDSPAVDFGTGDFSFSAWVRTQNNSGAIMEKRTSGTVRGYLFTFFGGALLVQLADPTTHSNFVSPAVPAALDGSYHLVTLTVDRDQATGGRIYIDDALFWTFNPTARQGSLDNAASLTIGDGWDRPALDGDIDQAVFYSRVLSAAEVVTMYAGGSPTTCP